MPYIAQIANVHYYQSFKKRKVYVQSFNQTQLLDRNIIPTRLAVSSLTAVAQTACQKQSGHHNKRYKDIPLEVWLL